MDVVMNDATTARWLPIRLRGMLAGAMLASGMTALAAPPHQRAAMLLPPVKMEPGELPALARGAMDDLPGAPIGSTPVVRKQNGNSPAWLTGVDPNVIPASGLNFPREKNETKTPFLNNAKELPPLTPTKLMNAQGGNALSTLAQPRLLDKSKIQPMAERMVPPQEILPDPNMPLRGTASNGAPVMAGPPAYRWYGYGSVTPGANQYAPAGQYPKASANWYGVTGATPGAFPVPVVAPYRATPGNEPPSYVANPPVRTFELPRNSVIAVPSPVGVRPNPVMNAKPPASVQPGIPAMPPISTIGTSATAPKLPTLPQPIGVPVMPTPPKPEPVSVTPSPGKPIAGSPVMVTKPANALLPPAPLPPTLSEDSTWKPGSPAATPTLPPPDLFLEPGAKLVKNEITARGQMPEASRPDSAIALIQGVCKGRADGIDVRWTNSRKLTVCFEVRTAPDANRLVKDISARPELAPFAIDFCVLVK